MTTVYVEPIVTRQMLITLTGTEDDINDFEHDVEDIRWNNGGKVEVDFSFGGAGRWRK